MPSPAPDTNDALLLLCRIPSNSSALDEWVPQWVVKATNYGLASTFIPDKEKGVAWVAIAEENFSMNTLLEGVEKARLLWDANKASVETGISPEAVLGTLTAQQDQAPRCRYLDVTG